MFYFAVVYPKLLWIILILLRIGCSDWSKQSCRTSCVQLRSGRQHVTI